ncbi:MAG: hypothetical protein H0W54_07040 [Rubrobacter sp.]|nr:hypothetical protein [Rubrobacter sp.]
MTTEKLALVAFRVVASTGRRSRATVRISRGGRDHAEAEAEGDGSMNALFRAANAAIGSGVRSRAFASTLSTITTWSGRHESQLTSRTESTRGGARARMRSRRRPTPTCTRSPHICPIRFQEPAWSEPLRNLANGSSTPGWRTPARCRKQLALRMWHHLSLPTQRRDDARYYVRLDHGEEERRSAN